MQVLDQQQEFIHDLTNTITLRLVPATARYETQLPISIHHPYVSLYWTGILGPTTLGLARIANTLCATTKTGILTVTVDELFRQHCGVAFSGKWSAGRRAMRRISDYGLASWDNDTTTLTVTKHIGPVPASQVMRHDPEGIERHNQILTTIKNGGRR